MKYGELIPAGVGYATTLADFDWETKSDAGYRWDHERRKWASLPGYSNLSRGLPAVGTRPYVEHYSFAPILLAYDLKDGAGPRQWEIGQSFGVLYPLFEHIRAGLLIEAHSAEFEREVWNGFCVPVWGWPVLRIEQQRCSAAKARAAGFPGSLEPLTAVLDTPTKKDPDGKRLMQIFSMPRNPTKKDPRTHTLPREAPEEWAKYKSYNVTDIVSESEVSARCPDLSPIEQHYWFIDQRINDRGMATDAVARENCIAIVEQAYAKYGAEFREITGGIEPTELQQFQGWLAGRDVHMPDMTEKTIAATVDRLDDKLKEGDPADAHHFGPAHRALVLRQMLGSASVKKLYALRGRTARDGRIHGMYMMYATHHGRTGGYGVQPANLYKGTWHTPAEVEAALAVIASRSLAAVEAAYPNIGPLEVIGNVLRSLFVAGPGKTLVSSDYSAIEDVVLAALAGEQWVLDVHRTHGMIYEAQIAMMTGIPFEEFVKHRVDAGGVATYSPDGNLLSIKGGKHHPLRQQGKLAKLSGGYASWINGWKKFGADEYYEDDQAIKRAILSYRSTVPATVEFWGGQTRNKFNKAPDGSYAPERAELYGLEGAAISAVLNPGTAYRVGLIGFQMHADCMYMQLPSGRLISYHAPRLEKATRQWASPWELALSYEGWNSNPEKGPPAWIRMDLYGGVLTQNATGGTARDIQMHGMSNVEALGYPIVMHTYDETVSEVDVGFGSIAEFEAGLNDLPDYAKGWPIFARGGWTGGRYGKWD
jgi:DNA polymerase